MLKGYWNGEPTATFEGVLYKVGPAETPTWWQNRVVGQVRQGILITYAGDTWLIDNECGDGYYKVTKGQGSPRCGHKSVANYTIERVISDNEINTEYNAEKLRQELEEHDRYLEENHPSQFKRLKALRESMSQFQKTFK